MRVSDLPAAGPTVRLAAAASETAGLADVLLELRASDADDFAVRAPDAEWRAAWPSDVPSRRTAARLLFSERGGSAVYGWLASQEAGEASTALLTLQLHIFAADLRLTDPLDLAVDDKLVEELRRSRRIGSRDGTGEAMAWLSNRFLLPR